jgi:hypothetical protein
MTIKIKRNKIDLCNICREKKPLSWDHVPPKGGIHISSMEIKEIFYLISGKENNVKNISQNGVKYRTICSDCNSKIGTEFDPTLNELNKTLINFLTSSAVLPKYSTVKVKPIRLMKAVLSHLVAAKLNIDDVIMDKNIRETIFLDKKSIPKNLHIHYWIYPFDCTVILRDFAIPIQPGNFSKCTSADIIKYFPLAFIISDTENFRELDSLSQYRNLGIDDEINLKIDLGKMKDLDWPERVDETNIVFMSQESQNGIFAKPR